MKKETVFFLFCFFIAWFSSVRAQQFVPTLDSLAVTFTVHNGKPSDIQPRTSERTASAQRSTADLLFTLNDFFAGNQYRKAKSFKVKQYWINAGIIQDGITIDSIVSLVYIVEIPNIRNFKPKQETENFFKVKSRPSKVPEQFFISSLNNDRLILTSIRSFLYLDPEASRQRQRHVNVYLDWLLEKYR